MPIATPAEVSNGDMLREAKKLDCGSSPEAMRTSLLYNGTNIIVNPICDLFCAGVCSHETSHLTDSAE